MKTGTIRKIMRWVHIILSIPLIGYFYGPVATQPYAVYAIKYVFLPVIVLSGFWMWKGHLLKKWRHKVSR